MLQRALRTSILTAAVIVAAVAGLAVPSTAVTAATAPPDVPTPPVTANPFIPEDRSISDCVSALPKPGCGSEERGGMHQYLVFAALVGGLSIIGWRIVAGARKNLPAPPAPDAQWSTSAGSPAGADTDTPSGSTTG